MHKMQKVKTVYIDPNKTSKHMDKSVKIYPSSSPHLEMGCSCLHDSVVTGWEWGQKVQ